MTISEDRSAWRRRLGGLFRGANPLPGTLCDETPTPVPPTVAAKWQPDVDGAGDRLPYYVVEGAMPSMLTAPPYLAEHTTDLGIIDLRLSRPNAPLAEVLRDHIATLEAELADRTRERDDEAAINAALRETIRGQRARIEGLELTVQAYAAAAQPAPPLPVPHQRC